MYLIIFTLFFLQSFCVAKIGREGVFFHAILLNDAERVKQLLKEEPGLVHAKLETDKKSPLHIAAIENCCQIIEILIKAGAVIENKDNHGNTPLHAAVIAGSCNAVELLIGMGAEVDSKNIDRQTPLNIAVRKNDLKTAGLLQKKEIILSLLQAGANIYEKGMLGKTPLDKARKWRYVEIIKILEKHAALAKTKTDLREGMAEKRPSNLLS